MVDKDSENLSTTLRLHLCKCAGMGNLLPETTLASQEEKFLTEDQLLTRLPVCRRTIFNWIQAGKLPCVKIGRRKLYHWPTVEAALLRQQKGLQ